MIIKFVPNDHLYQELVVGEGVRGPFDIRSRGGGHNVILVAVGCSSNNINSTALLYMLMLREVLV